jgi:hypothetical protein
MILSLPVSAIMLQGEMGDRNFPLVARLGAFLGGMDRVAQYGSLVLVLSGIGQMWAKNITIGSLGGQYFWLFWKILLFALLVINGAATAGPAIRKRVRLLRQLAEQGEPTPEQELELTKSATFMKLTGIPQMAILLAILLLVSFSYRPGF